MTKKKRNLILIGGAVVFLGGIAAINLMSGGPEKEKVQTDLAFVENISESVSASGRIQPKTKVDITSQVSGEIMSIAIHEGDWVKRGQTLLQIDTANLASDVRQQQYSLDEMQSRLEKAKSTMEQDKAESERQTKLFEKKLTSETAFTNAKYAYENSRADLKAMESQLKTQRAGLDKAMDNFRKTRIISPMDGVVTLLAVEVGEIAQAQTAFTQGKTLMTVADLAVFEVEVDVDETEVAKTAIGQKTEIRIDAFPDTVFIGHVVEIGNSALVQGLGTSELTTNFRVKIRFNQPEKRLRPGMSATVDITTANVENAVLAPYGAVIIRELDPDSLKKGKSGDSGVIVSDANAADKADRNAADKSTSKGKKSRKEKIRQTGVFVMREGKAVFHEVKTGIADQRNIVIVSGLAAGDTVISGPFQTLRKLKDGDLVEVEKKHDEKKSDDK